MSRARDRVLGRVRAAVTRRPREEHPGGFAAGRPGAPDPDPLRAFEERLVRAGGEVARVRSAEAARAWLGSFALGLDGVAFGATVPSELRVAVTTAPAEEAALGVSMARGAVAETGSLLLDAREGRRTQLLPPTHVVLVRGSDVHATLTDALLAVQLGLPSALGLHSGPSKSADIGQILVKGVHGPGRLVALLIEED